MSSVRFQAETLLLPGLATALTFATVAQGAFVLPQATLWTGLLLALVLVATRLSVLDVRRVAVGFGLLGAALLASAAANGWPQQARMPLAVLLSAGCVFLVARTLILRGERRHLLELFELLGIGVALFGLVALAFHWFPGAMWATGLWRVSSTFGYANAAASMLALTLPAALLLADSRPGASSRLGLYFILAGLMASLSRGAVASLVVIGAALVLLGGRSLIRLLTRPLLGALVALGGLLPAIMGDQGRAVPGLLGIAIGAVVAAWPAPRDVRAHPARRVAGTVAGALLVVTILVNTGHATRFAHSRLSFLSEPRLGTWVTTIREAFADPVLGSGPGTFQIVETVGRRPTTTLYAHNEFLERLFDSGAVGFAAVLLALASFAGHAFRSRPGKEDPERLAWAAGTAACAGFVLHSSVDILWRFPVLVGMAFLWLAVAAVRPSHPSDVAP